MVLQTDGKINVTDTVVLSRTTLQAHDLDVAGVYGNLGYTAASGFAIVPNVGARFWLSSSARRNFLRKTVTGRKREIHRRQQ